MSPLPDSFAGNSGTPPWPWPLVGRDDVLSAVAAIIAQRGPGSLLLSGRPGVGRSRLAHEVLERVGAAGFATEWFVATPPGASIPFGAFARLLDGLELDGADPLRLFRGVVERLTARAGGRRLVVGVDDAHLLDQAGAALLHQVAATGTAFVVATARGGEPTPEPIVALGKDGLGARLEVLPLSRADFERLLETVLDGPVDGRAQYDLVASARGDVSFLFDLVSAGLESKALANVDGVWRWAGSPGSHPRLVAAVESRLGGVTADERALVELIADAQSLELGLLERLVPAGTIESVERKDLLEVVHDNRRLSVRLAHPLHGEAVRATTPPLRARALRRRLASALRDSGRRRRRDLLRHAVWSLDGGEAVDGGELLAAASQAASSSDDQLAERLSRAASGRSGSDAAETELADVAFAGAVNRYFALGATSEADEGLRRAENMLCGVLSRHDDALAATWQTRLDLLFAIRTLAAGQPDQAARAAAMLRGTRTDQPTRLHALVVAAAALAETGRTSEALAAAAEGTALCSRWNEESSRLWLSLLAASTVAHRYAGNLTEADTLAAAGYRRTVLHGDDAARTLWTVLVGRVALDRGRIRTALRWLREGTALSRAVSPLGQLPRCLANLCIAAGQAGDEETAKAALAEIEGLPRPAAPDPDLILARAWAAAAGGETSRATKLALDAGNLAWEQGQLNAAVSAFHDAARLGGVDEALRRMTHIVPAVDGRRAPTMLAHAAALQANDGLALDTVSASFEEMGATWLAAEAAAKAAVAHRRNGKLGRSLLGRERAEALQNLCEGARTLAPEPPEGDVLTRREREVAALAARGLSNRNIADLLVVSVRTVENQLYRVYAKLGVSGRDELTTALGLPRTFDNRHRRGPVSASR